MAFFGTVFACQGAKGLRMNYELALDYESIFRDRLVIITGAARSGTTLLGKIVGSMQPSYFLFESTIMKLISALPERLLPMLLFEDYFLPKIQGYNLNLNEADDSCEFNYRDKESIWASPRTRADAIRLIEEKKPLFIIKATEFQPLFDRAVKVFPGLRFINITRNGNDVLNSSINHGWFGDEYKPVDILVDGCPWYIDDESRKVWSKWNPVTRAACVWRTCVEYPITSLYLIRQLKYEHLLLDAQSHARKLAELLGLGIMKITEKHIADIHLAPCYPSIFGSIQEPEKAKYAVAMEKLEYQI